MSAQLCKTLHHNEFAKNMLENHTRSGLSSSQRRTCFQKNRPERALPVIGQPALASARLIKPSAPNSLLSFSAILDRLTKSSTELTPPGLLTNTTQMICFIVTGCTCVPMIGQASLPAEGSGRKADSQRESNVHRIVVTILHRRCPSLFTKGIGHCPVQETLFFCGKSCYFCRISSMSLPPPPGNGGGER